MCLQHDNLNNFLPPASQDCNAAHNTTDHQINWDQVGETAIFAVGWLGDDTTEVPKDTNSIRRRVWLRIGKPDHVHT